MKRMYSEWRPSNPETHARVMRIVHELPAEKTPAGGATPYLDEDAFGLIHLSGSKERIFELLGEREIHPKNAFVVQWRAAHREGAEYRIGYQAGKELVRHN